jgi:hypothetical protein
MLLAAASLLVAGATGCASNGPTLDPGPGVSSVSPSTGRQIVLRFDHHVVPATLADTAAGRQFTTLLPMTLELHDPWGQAKSGPIAHPIEGTEAVWVTDPEAGGIYYAPDSGTLAIFYDDLGQTVPSPGLVRLGAVDADLASIAAAGNRVRVSVDLSDGISS